MSFRTLKLTGHAKAGSARHDGFSRMSRPLSGVVRRTCSVGATAADGGPDAYL